MATNASAMEARSASTAPRIDLDFHRVQDIREVFDTDPACKFWVVDYEAAPVCLTLSQPWDELTEASQLRCLLAYLDQLLKDHQ